jgi:hypothetical protein
MAVITLLAPATRIGYLLYPINFFVWAHLFSDSEQTGDALLVPDVIGATTPRAMSLSAPG